jgi:hypothetical protein
VKTLFCFDRVVSIMIIFMDRGSCSSGNVSLIMQILSGRLLVNGGMYQTFLHIDE